MVCSESFTYPNRSDIVSPSYSMTMASDEPSELLLQTSLKGLGLKSIHVAADASCLLRIISYIASSTKDFLIEMQVEMVLEWSCIIVSSMLTARCLAKGGICAKLSAWDILCILTTTMLIPTRHSRNLWNRGTECLKAGKLWYLAIARWSSYIGKVRQVTISRKW